MPLFSFLENKMAVDIYDDDTSIITKEKLKKPSMYTLVFHNDDYSTMDFVVMVMVNICNISLEEANITMMKVHNEGKANVGNYTFEIAEDKCYRIVNLARQAGHPLLVQVEEI